MHVSHNLRKSLCRLLCLLLLCCGACSRNPVTGRLEVTLMGAQEETRVGADQHEAILKLYGKHEDEALQQHVTALGEKLVGVSHARPFDYHFTVIDSGEINAFALPGGYIYLTRGLLAQCNSEAELAGVIGHEIGHVTARHHARQQIRAMGLQIGSLIATVFLGEAGFYLQRYIDLLFTGVYQSFGRQLELESDQLGQEYAADGGWDPRETTAFLKTLDRLEERRDRTVFHGFFASHPETYERIEEAEQRGNRMVVNRDPGIRGREALLRLLDGLPYGNRPELGELEKALYRNAHYGISVQFPENWETITSRGVVVARKPEGNIFMQLITAEPKKEDYLARVTSRADHFIKLRELAEQFEAKSRWRRETEERTVINEIPTFVTTYKLQSYLGRFHAAKGHFFLGDSNVFVLLSFTPVGQETLSDYYFKKVFASVRKMDPEEMAALQLRKVVIYEVQAGDTFESIAVKYYGTPERAREIARLNGLISTLYPTPGDLLKIVVRSEGEEEAESKGSRSQGSEGPSGGKTFDLS